jgi:hypothetical protein
MLVAGYRFPAAYPCALIRERVNAGGTASTKYPAQTPV